MKRPIKFRGRVPKFDECAANPYFEHDSKFLKEHGGEFAYGFVEVVEDGDLFTKYCWLLVPCAAPGFCQDIPVEADSVAQLCGYDKNGAEVYEGDILVDELDQEHVAEIYDRPNVIAALTLKK